MSAILEAGAPAHSPLAGITARDLMTPSPVSLRADATVAEVVAFLADSGYSAAPVIDDAGHPVGVVSRTDVVTHDRARVAAAGDTGPGGTVPESGAVVRATDLMTPAVFSVTPETPAEKVAEEMVELDVHRLFVVDRDGLLIGVISALDLLRHFCP
jgi:CBS domain-containing protein